MAATPKTRTSKGRTRRRRSHHRVALKTLVRSKQTGKLVPKGVVCEDNPNFKGIEVIKAKPGK